jgi:hypothetical protein
MPVDVPNEPQKPPPLDYYTSGKGTFKAGATIPARIVAGIASLLFGGFSLYCLWFVSLMGDRPDREAGLVALASSAFLLLIALGLIGKHREDCN